MSAVALLTRCRDLGIDLAAGPDGALVWASDSEPPAEVLESLAVYKAAIVALLVKVDQPWDAVEADRLLAELRAEVTRVESEIYRGQVPAPLATLLRDTLVIGERYIRDHKFEAARGWDALALLRALVPHVRDVAARWKPTSGTK